MTDSDAVIGGELTPREREVLRMVAAGLTNREIGEALFITESTAGVHVSHLMAKLGVGSRTEAAAWAFRAGLVEAGPGSILVDGPSGDSAPGPATEPPSGWFETLRSQLRQHPGRAAIIGGVAVLAVIAVSLAIAVLSGRQPVAGDLPSPSASPSLDASASPSVEPSASATVEPSGAPSIEQSPTAGPPSPTPIPLPRGTWSATGVMSGIRIDQTATLLRDGTVLVAGGSFGGGPYATLASAELYDPESGEWTATASMVEDRQGHTATLLDDGTVLVVGGTSELGQQGTQYRATAELFDPITRAWRLTTPMNSARAGHTATLLADGTVLVAGGSRINDEINWELLASAEIYDPLTATWTPVQQMAEGRQGHTATRLIGGTVLVAGGVKNDNGASARSATVYDPASRTWSSVGPMITGRSAHSATLLGDGTVLVVGGSSDLGPEASAEAYQPTTQSWTRIASMAEKRSAGTATLLRDGRVLAVGGYGSGGYGIGASTTPSAEIYDPRIGQWTPTAWMPQGRRGHRAILLINGNVLVEGGNWSGEGLPTVTFLYDPNGGP